MVSHLAFFTSFQSEQRPVDQTTFAGLVVLRLVDDWLMIGPHAITADGQYRRMVHETIAAVPAGDPIGPILRDIVDIMMEATHTDIGVIAPQLLAYGNRLAYDGRWQLAIDVFEIVYRWTRRRKRYTTTVLDTVLNLASAHRNSGDNQSAEKGYALLKHVAIKAKDEPKQLVAEIGFATLAEERGDFAGAEARTQNVLQVAHQLGLQDKYALALQKLGFIAYSRGQYDLALRHSYNALQLTEDLRNKDRLINTISVILLESGSWDVAQNSFRTLVATAQEEYVRQAATLNLFHLTALTRDAEDFYRYRETLQEMDLPPTFRVSFYRYLAKGHARFTSMEEAREMLQTGIALAEAHRFKQELTSAKQELAALGR